MLRRESTAELEPEDEEDAEEDADRCDTDADEAGAFSPR
jgi:hypothetical protein